MIEAPRLIREAIVGNAQFGDLVCWIAVCVLTYLAYKDIGRVISSKSPPSSNPSTYPSTAR